MAPRLGFPPARQTSRPGSAPDLATPPASCGPTAAPRRGLTPAPTWGDGTHAPRGRNARHLLQPLRLDHQATAATHGVRPLQTAGPTPPVPAYDGGCPAVEGPLARATPQPRQACGACAPWGVPQGVPHAWRGRRASQHQMRPALGGVEPSREGTFRGAFRPRRVGRCGRSGDLLPPRAPARMVTGHRPGPAAPGEAHNAA